MRVDAIARETLAYELFREEWQRVAATQSDQLPHDQHASSAEAHERAAHWLLPGLVRLLEQTHDRPVADLTPAIRDLVAERQCVDASGDPVMAGGQAGRVEVQVAVFVRVLERVRQRALDHGVWSDMAAAPEMFG